MLKKSVTKLIDALSARTRLGEIMEEAEKESTRFLVSRRGKPSVVILGVEDYLRNVVKKSDLLAEIQLEAQKAGLNKMTGEQIDAQIRSYRSSKKNKK
ncbi:MAG: type II toxin-antitoxin system Phd/YefM family antitoxin [Deltaproteobacteria bacterium]|jgi:prevent-host-death family protein|nr:type II toxin-antitoxin system Phd/YefM family antitoxin [Deltaproteobacteria bacterium]